MIVTVYNGTSSPEDSRAEGQSSWLPCHERAAGRPLVVRLVSPSQPGGRRRREALGPGRGRPRSQGDEPGREEKREKQAEDERRRISSELRFRVCSFKNSSSVGKTLPTQEQPPPPQNTPSLPPPAQ